MTIEKRLSDALAKEVASRNNLKAEHFNLVNERYERLVKAGAVQPEKYRLAPINPISMSDTYSFV